MNLPQVSAESLGVQPVSWSEHVWFSSRKEFEVFIALVRNVKPRIMVETGVNTGRTAKATLALVPSITNYVGIDVEKGYVTSKKVQQREIPDHPGHLVKGDPRFRLIVKPRGSLDLNALDLPPCDVMFIDGDHGREAVMHDTMLAASAVRPGGIIIWHDYFVGEDVPTLDVKPVLDELRTDGMAIVHIDDTWLAFQRQPSWGPRC